MRSRKKTRWLLALLCALALLAAACGGGDDGDDASSEPGAEEDGEPRPGGTLTMAYASDIENLDPLALSSFNVHQRIGLVYNRLLAFDIGPDVEYTEQKLIGDLAEEWEIAKDGLTYTFHLRDDVVWHDLPPVNGRPFVADDVVATFQAIQERGFQRYMLENVTSIEAPDDHTVVLRLSQPFAPLENFMANHHMWILPREGIEGQFDVSRNPVGTGPFMMTRREPNITTEYAKNPTYFEEGLPYLDGVRILVVPDQQARMAAFRNGEIDLFTTGLSPEEQAAIEGTNPDAVWRDYLSAGLGLIGMNPAREPFDDHRVREAVNLAIDREGMGEAIYDGGTYAAPVAPALDDYALPLEERKELQQYDPDAARKLLAEAGLGDGFTTNMMVTPGYGEQYIRQAQWVIADLAAVGIDVNLELVEYGTYFGARWPNVDYDMMLGPQTPFLEPDEWLRAMHMTDAPRNWFGVSDPTLDEMLVEQTQILDPKKRTELIMDIQRYIMTEVDNPIQTWTTPTRLPQSADVKGYDPHASYGYYTMKQVWLDR